MNFRCLFVVFFLLLFPAQNNARPSPGEVYIDSLKKANLGVLHDTIRSANLDLIAFYYQSINPDSGLVYAEAAHLLAKKANWKRGQILALMDLSNNYTALSQFTKGIEKGELALDLLKNENMPQVELAVLSNLSLIYKDLGYHGKALEYLLKAVAIENRSEKKNSLPVLMENIGSIHLEQSDFPKADSLFNQSYAILLQRRDSAGMARSLLNQARLEQKRKRTKEAVVLLKQALSISESFGNLNSMQIIYANLGIAFSELRWFDSAIVCHTKALLLSEQMNLERSSVINSGNLGQAWYSKATDSTLRISANAVHESLRKAKGYLLRSCDSAFRNGFRGPFLEFSENLTQIYLRDGDFKAASKLLQNRMASLKLVNEEEEKVKMVRLESQHILEIKEYELAENKKNLEISDLELQVQKRNVLSIILLFVFLATLGLVGLVYLKKRGDFHKSVLQTISLTHSHDIRGPLARIIGLAELLKNDQLAEEERIFICKSMEESAQQLDRNITNIIYKSSHETD